MRVLGVDYGDRHVGLALSDALQMTAQPLGTYILQARDEDNRGYFRTLVRDQSIVRIVIGLPLRMDGTPGSRVEKTRTFAAWMEKTTGLPVEFWDERLTTHQAMRSVQEQKIRIKDKRAAVNQIAAVIILQGYLESRRPDEPPRPVD
jgi:putative Holliday junction resolvase